MNVVHLDKYRSPKENFQYAKLLDGTILKMTPGIKLYCIYDYDKNHITFLNECNIKA